MMVNRRIVDSTRKGYRSHIRKFVKWLEIHHPDQIITVNDVRQSIIPIPRVILMKFLGDARFLNKNGLRKPPGAKPIAKTTMNGIVSAIGDLYRAEKLTMSNELRIEVTNFMHGYRRTIAAKKQRGKMKMFEGKRPITFRGYCQLALYALSSLEKDAMFAHLYVVMTWNLFSRSNNIAKIMYRHIEWKEDALMIVVPTSKSDQEGEKSTPKHCFADPFKPEICPVLALALHIFCTSFRADVTDRRIFAGSSLETKFSNWIKKALKSEQLKNHPDLKSVIEELGAHSFRYFVFLKVN